MHLDESVSAEPNLSPGIVEDNEVVLRELFNPHHIKDGKIQKRAITINDLLKDGFSVHQKRRRANKKYFLKKQNIFVKVYFQVDINSQIAGISGVMK